MKIGYLYGFQVLPLKGGNHVHAYQLIKRFLNAGDEVLTIGDASIPGVVNYDDSQTGLTEFLRDIDILYVRIDARFLRGDIVMQSAIRDSKRPVVWEINSPSNEGLAFSWLGGNRATRGGLWAVADRVRRSIHAGRKHFGIIKEERLRRELATYSEAAICVSDAVAKYADVELGFKSIRVIPNGSDHLINTPEREPIKLPDRLNGKFNILYAGSPIYPWQGLDLVSKLIGIYEQKHPEIGFILLTNQPSADIQSASNVAVLKSVPYDEVGAYIVAADACLAIFRDFDWSKWGFHGSPTKLFDYMSCGRPVLASGVGQVIDVITDGRNGLLIENTVEDLDRKIQYLVSNPDAREQIGSAARDTVVDRYNWDRVADDTLSLFRDVIND